MKSTYTRRQGNNEKKGEKNEGPLKSNSTGEDVISENSNPSGKGGMNPGISWRWAGTQNLQNVKPELPRLHPIPISRKVHVYMLKTEGNHGVGGGCTQRKRRLVGRKKPVHDLSGEKKRKNPRNSPREREKKYRCTEKGKNYEGP